MGAIHTRVSPQHDLGDVKDMLNRVIDNFSGAAGAGQRVMLTDYDGVLKDPYGGANLSTTDFSQTIRNTASGGNHQAILLSATAANATPTAANSVFIVQDGAAAIGAGKNLNLFNTAGSNAVTLVHSGTDNHLKTLGGFWALGALNVGSALTATTAGDALVQHALNVGDTVSATDAGDGYMKGGLSVGTYANPAAGEVRASAGVFSFAEAVSRTYLEASISGAYSLTNTASNVACSVTLSGLGQWLVIGCFEIIEAGAGDVGQQVYGGLSVGSGGTILLGDLAITTMGTNTRETRTASWLVNVTSGTPAVTLNAQRNAGTGSSTIGVFTTIKAVFVGKPS